MTTTDVYRDCKIVYNQTAFGVEAEVFSSKGARLWALGTYASDKNEARRRTAQQIDYFLGKPKPGE